MQPAVLLAASLALTAAQSAKIDAVVSNVMQASHIPGLSVGVARKGTVVFLRGFGTRDCTSDAAANGYTVYRIGSITKQFTAALVMQEAESGVLPLDAEVDGISVAQLLSQTSGLISYTDPGQTLNSALNAPPAFTPGTRWQYSNSNYYLLGTALQSVTRQSYATLLADRITRPLLLASTMLGVPDERNVAQGCRWNGSTWSPAPTDANDTPALAFSASGLTSNVPDLLAWLWNLYDGAIVSHQSFLSMTSSWKLADGTPTQYGFGFFTDDWYGNRIAQHSGFVDGFSAEDTIVLDDGTAVAALANADQVPLVPLVKSIVELVEPVKDSALVADFSHPAVSEDPAVTSLVKTLVEQLSRGQIDRSLLSASLSSSLRSQRLQSLAEMLQPLGVLQETLFNASTKSGDLTHDRYTLLFERGRIGLTLDLRSGKVEQFSFNGITP
jgi:CubicO group peptidase (beta-lactamase class C family)